jgi:hypothetical protein
MSAEKKEPGEKEGFFSGAKAPELGDVDGPTEVGP